MLERMLEKMAVRWSGWVASGGRFLCLFFVFFFLPGGRVSRLGGSSFTFSFLVFFKFLHFFPPARKRPSLGKASPLPFVLHLFFSAGFTDLRLAVCQVLPSFFLPSFAHVILLLVRRLVGMGFYLVLPGFRTSLVGTRFDWSNWALPSFTEFRLLCGNT